MREYATPREPRAVPDRNLTEALVRNASEHPHLVAYSVGGPTDGDTLTYADLLSRVRSAAADLARSGVGVGDRVLIWSSNRIEWTITDYALWFLGAVGVPVYPTTNDRHLATIISDCEPMGAVVESPEQRARVLGLGVEQSWWIADLGSGADEGSLPDSPVGREDLATLIYTSGTTGIPKGCRITHGNFLDEIDAALGSLSPLFEPEDASTLVVLPLAHVFARVVQLGAIAGHVRIGFGSSLPRLSDDLRRFRPTFLLGVPRIFEALYNEAAQEAAAAGRGRAFARATRVAIEFSTATETGRPGARLRARHAWAERAVLGRLREALGGRCAYGIAGGAPLGEQLGHFFRGAGVPVLEGYGLTETTAAICVNTPTAHRVGTVGRPLPGCAVRVADDGELLVRGPQVFAGYWHASDSPTEDGWLPTGDLAEIDEEGFVRITGRKEEILTTAGGKSVSPEALEQRIRAHRLVSHCLVVGDGRPYLGALITIDRDALEEWASAEGIRPRGDALLTDPRLVAEIQQAVDQANSAVSQSEWVRRFVVLPAEWSEADGHLTPSLKVRRAAILRDFRGDVESLFV